MPVVPMRPRSHRPTARPMPKISPNFLSMAASQMASERQASALLPDSPPSDPSTAAMQSMTPPTNG